MLPRLRVGLSAVVSKWCQMPPRQAPTTIPTSCILHTYAEYGRVTDGTRTRDLRSHNPMLCQLSYGHHAQEGFYQRKDA
jgi:hypothetical protein